MLKEKSIYSSKKLKSEITSGGMRAVNSIMQNSQKKQSILLLLLFSFPCSSRFISLHFSREIFCLSPFITVAIDMRCSACSQVSIELTHTEQQLILGRIMRQFKVIDKYSTQIHVLFLSMKMEKRKSKFDLMSHDLSFV